MNERREKKFTLSKIIILQHRRDIHHLASII